MACEEAIGKILNIGGGEKCRLTHGEFFNDLMGYLLATPRVTLRRKSDRAAIEELARFCREEEAGLVVFGIPRSPEGVESPFAARIRSFASRFAARPGCPCASTRRP